MPVSRGEEGKSKSRTAPFAKVRHDGDTNVHIDAPHATARVARPQ